MSTSDSNSISKSAEHGNTVILGAGIIGLSTAYYLSQSGNTKPDSIHLVDPIEELFQCASGFAGGFLAKDWFAPSTAPLGALSFALHAQLSSQHNGHQKWGYVASQGMSYSQDSEAAVDGSGEDWLSSGSSRAQASTENPMEGKEEVPGGKEGEDCGNQIGPKWLKRKEGGCLEVISKVGSTAQLDPLRLCHFLLGECVKRGVKLHQPARAISVLKDERNQLTGVRISENGQETDLPCTRVILASGAWTPRLFTTLFPTSHTKIPIAPLAGHSLLLKNPFSNDPKSEEQAKQTHHAVFAADNLGFSPEYFSRADGEIYLAGLNSTMIPLPETASDVKPIPAAVQQLKECAGDMIATESSHSSTPGSAKAKEVEVLRASLCFRPVTSSGRPIVTRVADERLGIRTRGGKEGGVFIAAGHGAWGIAMSLGTGMVAAEMVEGRGTSADVGALGLP